MSFKTLKTAIFAVGAILIAGIIHAASNTYTWIGDEHDAIDNLSKWTPMPDGGFTAEDKLVFTSGALVNVSGAITVGTIELNSASPVTFYGTSQINVTEIENKGTGSVSFECPVQFSGTYRVIAQSVPVKFPGRATATYPDNDMHVAESTDATRTLDGEFNFTAENWIVSNVGDYPWIVANNAVVYGKNFSGLQTSHHRILRVEQGGYACFTTVTNGWDRGDIDIDGTLEATKEVIVRTNPSGGSTASRFGRSGNIGTVKAPRIAKAEHSISQSLIPNLIVGSGGIGSVCQDYTWRFDVDTTITATDDFDVLAVYRSAGLHDWGIACNGTVTITFNVPEGKTVTYGTGFSGTTCTIRKTGAGRLVMTNTFNGNSGYIKQYANGTIIEEGTVRLAANGQLSTGPVTIASEGRLEIASGVTVSNQVDGEGTLYLEDGVTLSLGSKPWYVGSVELASGASVTLTSAVSTGTFALLTGVAAADAARFTLDGSMLSVAGDTLVASVAMSGAYVWNGANGADWTSAGNWLVGGVAPATAPTSADAIVFQNPEPVTVGGTNPLMVTKIITLSDDLVTFSCPVQFAGTYFVENAATAPLFAGGATATYADDSLTEANIPSHELKGDITFTANWTIPPQPAGNPFFLSAGSTLKGKVLAGVTYDSARPVFRIDDGAVATFDSVDVAGKLVFWLNGGKLVATGDITVGGVGTPRDFGYYNAPNIGTVEANGIFKNVTGYGKINLYVTNIVVGAGGFGMYRKDYTFQLYRDLTLTAKDDLTIHQPVAEDGPKDDDWGLNLDSHTFTINTANHTVTFDSWTAANAATVVKEGEGEMIMQSRLKQHTGGTIVKGGKLTVARSGSQGAGPLTVYPGAILANTVVVSHPYTLTLNADAILKPAQNTYFDVSGGTIEFPETGTVIVDMADFEFVNGVANPVLAGVAAGDEQKFTAVVPSGVIGSFSVSDGFLYYKAIAGGSAAADLFWHPTSEGIWSLSVAAWTNAAGTQVTFSPYANATVADAATISLPADVEANNVNITADGDVTLNGDGKLGGPGTIVKTGSGTFTFNAKGGLDAQPIIVSNGVFKLGEDLPTRALGATADTSPIIVEKGGTLDINYNVDGNNYDPARTTLTHDKLIKIAGDGVDGKGAIVSKNKQTYFAFSDVELTDDATIGGTVRSDFRHSTAYGAIRGTTSNSITGPGKRLTVKNTAKLVLVDTAINLGSILVTDGGALEFEHPAVENVPGGIHLENGTFSIYNSTCSLGLFADSGNNYIKNTYSDTREIFGAINIASGATLAHAAGNAIYTSKINGKIGLTGGMIVLTGNDHLDGVEIDGSLYTGITRIRQSGTYTGAKITSQVFSVADQDSTPVDVVFKDSSIDTQSAMVSWGCATKTAAPSGSISVGEGTVFNAAKLAIGDDGTSTDKSIKVAFLVDGGTFNLTNVDFFVAYNGPNSEFVINSGTANVNKATIKLRANNQALGGYNKSRFIQNGGVFNYGGAGFTARYEDNNEDGQIIFKGGEMNASANWAIPNWISTCFKDGAADGWTLNQADDTTATWTTALNGDGDVTLNGAATLVGNKEVQGAVGGKWTVGDGFTAGLQGAASFLGGLSIGEGATATIDVATDRSAVFTARDFGDRDLSVANSLVGRFNKQFGGSTRGTITHDETFLFVNYAQAARPFGDMNYTATYAVGQFYVDETALGTWSFEGRCDDRVALWIDGEQVLLSTTDCATVSGTKEITTAGWHSFRHVISDNAGGFGPAANHAYHTVGYKDPTMSAYARFNVENLKMRPAADFGDPNNANTIRWSHYKGTSSTVTADTFKRDDFAWDFCCITNNLQMLQWYGSNDKTWFNEYNVNRYEGWFYVTEENADKEWTFRTQYDDRAALWIDGVDSGLVGSSATSPTWKITLTKGWHSFRIQTADFTGNAGPWSGKGLAVSYQVAGGTETLFSEATLAMTVCPDGYVQGGVTLASNATLANNVAQGAAEVYGTVEVTGTGATVSGPFKFEGAKLAYSNVAANTRDFTTLLTFDNAAEDMFANLGGISVDFAADPTVGTVVVGPAYGLAAEDIESNVAVTVNGTPYTKRYSATVEDNMIKLSFRRGLMIIIQ